MESKTKGHLTNLPRLLLGRADFNMSMAVGLQRFEKSPEQGFGQHICKCWRIHLSGRRAETTVRDPRQCNMGPVCPAANPFEA